MNKVSVTLNLMFVLLAGMVVTTADAVCPNPPGCYVWGVIIAYIPYYCCDEPGGIKCQNYSAEVWRCAAGAERLRNIMPNGPALYSETCGTDGVCY